VPRLTGLSPVHDFVFEITRRVRGSGTSVNVIVLSTFVLLKQDVCVRIPVGKWSLRIERELIIAHGRCGRCTAEHGAHLKTALIFQPRLPQVSLHKRSVMRAIGTPFFLQLETFEYG
jgi:hypothetical protein